MALRRRTCDDRTETRRGAITTTVTPTPTRRLYRPRDHRIIAGVAAGLARHLGVPVIAVRIALVVLLGFNGLGLMLYAGFWAVLPQQAAHRRAAGRAATWPPCCRSRPSASGVILLQSLVFGNDNGVAGTAGWLIALIAVGAGVIWHQSDPSRRRQLGRPRLADALAGRRGRGERPPVLPVPLHRRRRPGRGRHHRRGRGLRAGRQPHRGLQRRGLRAGRPARRRRGGGAAAVAHVQPAAGRARGPHPGAGARRAGRHDPRPGAAHAGADPAQLRPTSKRSSGWPAGRSAACATGCTSRPPRRPSGSPPRWSRPPPRSRTPTRSPSRRVVVGDTRRATSRSRALVAAAREALVNAARHAGVQTVSLYAEVEADELSVFVRDRGVGLRHRHRGGVDRHGVRGSIIGRMQRHGGTRRDPQRRRRRHRGAADHARVAGQRRRREGDSAMTEPVQLSRASCSRLTRVPGGRPRDVPGRGARRAGRARRRGRRGQHGGRGGRPDRRDRRRTWCCSTCTCPTAAAGPCWRRCGVPIRR